MMKSSIKFWVIVSILLSASLLGACRKMTLNEDPDELYSLGKDDQALQSAKNWLDTKYDISVRLFIVRYNLARYLETGNKSYADEIDKYYQGAASLDPDRSHSSIQIFDEYMSLARYYDAAILLHIKKDQKAALALLDSYCPIPDYDLKVRCHVKNYWYFESAARGSSFRNYKEPAFIADLTVGMAYQDPKMIGHALELQAEYDVKHASERAQAYTVRNDWNDDVMRFYCKPLDQYRHYGPDTANYADYMAAYKRANCQLYIPPDEKTSAP